MSNASASGVEPAEPAEPADPLRPAAAADDGGGGPDAGSAAAAGPGRVTSRPAARRLLGRPEVGALAGAIAVYAYFYAVAPTFRQLDALATILYESSTLGIMAVAVALLMIGGEFDLSAGVAVITSALTASLFAFELTLNVWAGVLVALVVSLAIGAFNGILLIRTRLPSFLVTLGTFLMLQGLNIAVTKLITGNVTSKSIRDMDGFDQAEAVFSSSFTVLGANVRITVLWWLGFAALATWVLLRTRYGNWVFAVGGNRESARALGVPVTFVKISLFMVVGFAAWFVGMHQLFAYNTVQSDGGVGRELYFIAAAVIGGCLLTGGFGSVVGAVFGAFLFGMASHGIVYAGWEPDWFLFFLGAMLLLATLLNQWIRSQATRR